MQDSEEFEKSLGNPGLIERYEDDRARAIEPIRRKYEEGREESVRRKLRGIDEDRYHRRILNSCIFPFSESGGISKLGYSFVRASPLHELRVPNTDFLVYNPIKQIAILGEAKGSVEDPARVVDEMRGRIRIAKENMEYINTHYLNANASVQEFVLGVSFGDSNEIMKSVARKGGGITVWHSGGDPRDDIDRLSIVVPPKTDDGSHVSMRHADNSLNEELSKGVRTSYDFKTFFVDSHSVAKMLILTLVDIGKKDGKFEFEDLRALVRNEINYLDAKTVEDEAKNILEMGLAIGFIKPTEDKFVIDSRSHKPHAREVELREKWIDWSLRMDELKESSDALAPIKEKYLAESKKQTKLFDE